MSKLRIVAFDECQECGGGGVYSDPDGQQCNDCLGEGVSERRISLGELAGLLLPHLSMIIARKELKEVEKVTEQEKLVVFLRQRLLDLDHTVAAHDGLGDPRCDRLRRMKLERAEVASRIVELTRKVPDA
jgi:hypothetical protein